MKAKGWFLRRLAVRQNVSIGQQFHVGPGTVIWAPRSLAIGNDVYVGKHVTIEVDGEIGDGVLIANSVGIIGRHDHDINQIGVTVRSSSWVGDSPDRLSAHTVIGSDVWLGYGSIILSGVVIGDSAVVAAGSVVTADVPANAIVAGVPAKFVRNRFTDTDFDTHWAELKSRGARRRTH